jgi:cell division protein FtsB
MIDPEQAENAYTTAKQTFEEAVNAKDKVEANFTFKRARARYQVSKQGKQI